MEETATIVAALSTLTPSQLSQVTHSLLSANHHHHLRLSSLLSSPTLFSSTLRYLNSLSFSQKTLLIARHLLSSLHHLTRHFQSNRTASSPPMSTAIRQRDLDAVLLLLLFCETHQHNPRVIGANYSDWRLNLSRLFSDKLLTLSYSPIGASTWTVLLPYVEMVSRSRRLVAAMGYGGGKEAASAAAVVGLPAVEVKVGGRDCVICKEEMGVGMDVCELPCQHLFHWTCILPWLRKRNTCPYCRSRLPSDDVFGEIQRLWEVLSKMGHGQSLSWNIGIA